MHEKNGTATRVKGSRPGIADTWTPAVPEAPRDEAPPAETPGAGSTADAGQAAAEPAGSAADASQPVPVPAGGTAEGGEAEAGTEPEPDPSVTAEAAGNVLAIAQAAAGDLDAALAALETARERAARGRRAVKAAGGGRRAPATRTGVLRGLVEEHLRKFPEEAFTPYQVGKVLTRSVGAVANALDKLVASAPRSWSPTSPAPTGSPTPPRPPPRRSRRPRHQCGGRAQGRVTRVVPAVYPGCTCARPGKSGR